MPLMSRACLTPTCFSGPALCLLLVFTCGTGLQSAAAGESGGCDPDVWAVSTRCLPGICQLPDAAHPVVQRMNPGCRRWEPADLGLLWGEPRQPVVIFIHGNRYDHASALEQGWRLARRCADCGTWTLAPRTIIYSWPSEQDGKLLKDGRAKYRRCFSEGHYLAWMLGQIEPDRPVAIVGYSFGALIALEALEDLVVAEAVGRPVSPWRNRPGRTNLVFVAPAVRCDAFAPTGPYRETLACVDELSLTINSRDDALRFFDLVDRCVGAEALGFTGMPRSWMPGDVRFSCVDASPVIGRNHGFPLYMNSGSLSARICRGAAVGVDGGLPARSGVGYAAIESGLDHHAGDIGHAEAGGPAEPVTGS
jgi:pimeloyl-ACP methyl ester carboxylesterase